MFTIKLYAGWRTAIYAADFLTILRDDEGAEITLHRKSGDDIRFDVCPDVGKPIIVGEPARFTKAIIENAVGKTSEIIDYGGRPSPHAVAA